MRYEIRKNFGYILVIFGYILVIFQQLWKNSFDLVKHIVTINIQKQASRFMKTQHLDM